MGASFGAVASFSVARRYPGRFGRVLLQSGSFAFSDIGTSERGPLFAPVEEMVNGFRDRPEAFSEQVFVSCGRYESLIYENRSLVPVLQSTGMEVRYVEARDGHNWENWRDRLRDGLSLAVPRPGVDGLRVAGGTMADVTRRIGLSLGADVCWPICYEEMMRRLDLALPVGRRRRALRRRAGHDRALRPPPAMPLRPRRRPSDPLVHDQPGVDQEGRDHGRSVRLQQPVVHPGQREAHELLRHDGARPARPRHLDGAAEGVRAARRPRHDAGALRPAVRPRARSAPPSATRCS